MSHAYERFLERIAPQIYEGIYHAMKKIAIGKKVNGIEVMHVIKKINYKGTIANYYFLSMNGIPLWVLYNPSQNKIITFLDKDRLPALIQTHGGYDDIIFSSNLASFLEIPFEEIPDTSHTGYNDDPAWDLTGKEYGGLIPKKYFGCGIWLLKCEHNIPHIMKTSQILKNKNCKCLEGTK